MTGRGPYPGQSVKIWSRGMVDTFNEVSELLYARECSETEQQF